MYTTDGTPSIYLTGHPSDDDNGAMRTETVAIIIQEGGRLLSGLVRYFRNASPSRMPSAPVEAAEAPKSPSEYKKSASDVKSACLPCTVGHLGTCTGLLNESVRFARTEGIGSPEVIDRVNICLDELNAMERVDLRSEKIIDLPQWEKELALQALDFSRAARHSLESLMSTEDLERVAASTQAIRRDIGAQWFTKRRL